MVPESDISGKALNNVVAQSAGTQRQAALKAETISRQ